MSGKVDGARNCVHLALTLAPGVPALDIPAFLTLFFGTLVCFLRRYVTARFANCGC